MEIFSGKFNLYSLALDYDSQHDYDFDEAGNLIYKKDNATGIITGYGYNTAGQMNRVTRSGINTYYLYNAMGMRSAKIKNGISTRIKFVSKT